jgi:uncharacterized protein YkwD
MVDAVVAVLLVLLIVRGWFRGLFGEALELAGLVIGIVLAFRLGPVVGAVIEAMSGISTDGARLIGGLIVLVSSGIAAALAAHYVEQRSNLPAPNVLSRIGGSVIALVWGGFVATVALSLAVILPMPSAMASALESSAVTRMLTDPAGTPQAVFRTLAGDRVVESLLNLQRAVGESRVVVEGDEVITLPAVAASELRLDGAAANEVYELINHIRVDSGVDPLAWSPALCLVAEEHALEMYLEGYFSHLSPATGSVADRVEAAGITYLVVGENLALAATPAAVLDGFVGSPGHRINMLRTEYRRMGVAVVAGPLGLMTVVVFTG